MSEPVEQRGRHLRVAEHGGPFAEAEISRDDNAGALVKLAQQMEQRTICREVTEKNWSAVLRG